MLFRMKSLLMLRIQFAQTIEMSSKLINLLPTSKNRKSQVKIY